MKRRYQSETIDFILKLLEDIEDQGGRYRTLISLYEDEIVQSILYLLERENISLDEITRTELKPKIREVLKEADDKINRALNDFFWIGINVVSEDLLRNGQLSYNFASSLVSKNFETKDIYTMLREKYLQKPWCVDGKTYQVQKHLVSLCVAFVLLWTLQPPSSICIGGRRMHACNIECFQHSSIFLS